MSAKLGLSPEQEKSLRQTLEETNAQTRRLNEEVAWELALLHRKTIKGIRAILSPEQLTTFEKMHQRFHDRHPNIPEDARPIPDTRPKKRVPL